MSGLSFAWMGLAEDARVLPKGRSRVTFGYGQTAGITQTFNNDGQRESLVSAYNMQLNANNLKTFNSDLGALVQALNDTGLHYNQKARSNADHGITTDPGYPLLGDALSAGNLGVDAQVHREQYVLAIQHGVTDRLTLGISVPYITTQVKVNSNLSGVNTADDIYYGFQSSGGSGSLPIADYLNQLRSISNETFQGLLTSRGYARLEDYNSSGVGDTIMGGRYNYLNQSGKSGLWINSVQLGATAPTGRLHSPDKLNAVDFGSGAWSATGAHITNYSPKSWVTLSHSVYYTWQMPSRREMRVRSSPGDLLPDASSQENVSMDLGNKYWTSFGANFQVTRALSFDSSYEWYWKRADRFQGARADRDYSYLGSNTDTYTETLECGATISSVNAFLRHKFFAPGDLGVHYYLPVSGRNVPIAPYGTLELALYF